MFESPHHPTEADLAQFADGELDRGATGEIREHIRDCWECRTRVEEFGAAVAEFVRYRKQFLPTDVEPTRPWLDIRAHLEEIDQTALQKPLYRSRKVVLSLIVCCAAAGAWIGLRSPHPIDHPTTLAPAERQARNTPIPALRQERRVVSRSHSVPVPQSTARLAGSPELQVFASLHALGADLGDPIEIRRDAQDKVVVTGVGLAPSRRSEIESVLRPLSPSVRIEFKDAVTAPAQNASREKTVAAGEVTWQHELDSAFGGRASVEQVTVHALQQSDALLARAHALRRLETSFNADRVGTLSPSEREVLSNIRADHTQQIKRLSSALTRELAPLFSSVMADSTAKSSAFRLFATAKRVDDLLNILLAGAPSDLGFPQLVSDLHAGLTAIAHEEP